MLKPIFIDNGDVFENEYKGLPEHGKITLNRILDLFEKTVKSTNAKYLKCVDKRGDGISINNITDIQWKENLPYKKPHGYEENIENAVTMAFVEESKSQAASMVTVKGWLEQLSSTLAEKQVKPEDVRVFTLNEKGKLTTFGWYYDDEADTAIMMKNISPNEAARWYANNRTDIEKEVNTPTLVNKEPFTQMEFNFDGADADAGVDA